MKTGAADQCHIRSHGLSHQCLFQHARAIVLDDAVGKYQGRVLRRTATGLAYHWGEHFVLALDPIGKDLFAVQGTDDYRFHLVRENGVVSGLERVWKSGETVTYRRLD